MGDITDKRSLKGLMENIDIVINCAARLGQQGTNDDFYLTNVLGTENLLQDAVKNRVSRFIHISSLAVLSEYQDHFNTKEDQPYAQWWAEPYTPSKIEAEKMLLGYFTNDLKLIIIRPGWIWGPEDTNTLEIGKMVKSGIVPYIGNGNNILSLTYITNIIHAILQAVTIKNCRNKEIFNVVDNQNISQKQFLAAFAERLNPSAKYVKIPFKFAYRIAQGHELLNKTLDYKLSSKISRHNVNVSARNFKFDQEKVQNLLKFKPPIEFSLAVDQTIEWIYNLSIQNNIASNLRSKQIPSLLLGATSMVHFAITNWCNAKCVFCNYPNSKKQINVNVSDAIKAINALKRLGVGIISLTGGEPFLNKNIFKIAYHASTIGMIVFTGTNGSIMTEDDVLKLQRANVRSIWISYEGPDDKIFDKNRGIPGLGNRIRNDLKWLNKAKIDNFAICVINKSIKDYRRFIDHLIDIGFNKVKFDYPMINLESSYLGYNNIDLINYTPQELEKVIEQIINLKKSNYRGFTIINPIIGLENAINYYKNGKTQFGCTAGKNIFYLDWNLELYRCTRLPEKFGKIFDVNSKNLSIIDCNKCYYQGTRDYDGVYHFINSIKNINAKNNNNNPINRIYSLANKDNLDGFRSLLEISALNFD